MGKESDSSRTQLLVGILGLVGVIIAALIGVFAPIIQENLRQKNLPTQTPIVIIATPTVSTPVPPDETVSTTAPTVIPSPEPTFTFTPPPVPFEAGKDWLENCINIAWQVFPTTTTTENDGKCYKEPVAQAFSMHDQHLSVFFENKVSSAEIVGMFAEVPPDAIVEINIHLEQIDIGELWVGLMGDPNFEANGLVVAAPPGNANNSAFSIRTMPDGEQLTLTSKFKKDNGNYLISFDVKPGAIGVTLEKYAAISPVPAPSDKKYLFVGYRALFGSTNHIEGDFFDLKITPR